MNLIFNPNRIVRLSTKLVNLHQSKLISSVVSHNHRIMDLKQLVRRLEEYAAPHVAYDSDNVGLLVEPSDPLYVKRLLVTNDLTEPVLEEAISREVQLIVSYHPAIYAPLKRLTQAEWKQRSIVKCIERHIAVYSPHSTWDSIDGGINDWILQAFGWLKSHF